MYSPIVYKCFFFRKQNVFTFFFFLMKAQEQYNYTCSPNSKLIGLTLEFAANLTSWADPTPATMPSYQHLSNTRVV